MIDDDARPPRESMALAPLLRLAWQDSRRQVYEQLRQAGYEDLSPADLVVFLYPSPEGARPTDLAAGALMSKQALNRTIRHLERSGYLQLKTLSSDRRARVVRLTDRGQRLLGTIKQFHAEIEADWSSRIGRRRLEALRGTMIDLTAQISG